MLARMFEYVSALDFSDSRTQSLLLALCTLCYWLLSKWLDYMYGFENEKMLGMPVQSGGRPQLSLTNPSASPNISISFADGRTSPYVRPPSIDTTNTRIESLSDKGKLVSEHLLKEFMKKFFARLKTPGITVRLIRNHTIETRHLTFRDKGSQHGFRWHYLTNTIQRFMTSKIWRLHELKIVQQKGKHELWQQAKANYYPFSKKMLHLVPVNEAINDTSGGISAPTDGGDDTPSSQSSMDNREKEDFCIDGVDYQFEFVQNLYRIDIRFEKKMEKIKSKTYELYVIDKHVYNQVFKGLDFMRSRAEDIEELLPKARMKTWKKNRASISNMNANFGSDRRNSNKTGNNYRNDGNGNDENDSNADNGYGQFIEADDASEVSGLTSSTYDTDITAGIPHMGADDDRLSTILEATSQSTTPQSTQHFGSGKHPPSGNTMTFLSKTG